MSAFSSQNSDCGFYARLLLDRINIKEIPVDPWKVAEKMGIPVIERKSENRFDGFLLNVDGEMAIVINSSIKHAPRKNFTIAHEIGHAEIPHHKSQEFKCLSSSIGIMKGKELETEANDFAAELLMPASFIKEEIDNHPIGLEVIKSIAEKYKTSLTSSEVRYINFCTVLAVLVLSECGRIKFSILSNDMNLRLGMVIRPVIQKDTSLNVLSLAHDFFKNGGNIQGPSEAKESVDISAWFPGLDYSRYECYENSAGLPNFNRVISLIWLKEKYYAEDDSDESY